MSPPGLFGDATRFTNTNVVSACTVVDGARAVCQEMLANAWDVIGHFWEGAERKMAE